MSISVLHITSRKRYLNPESLYAAEILAGTLYREHTV